MLNGRYRVVSAIGKGAQARVYLAWDERLHDWRAVKVLAAAYLDDAPVRARFDGEARMMAGFGHRNVMPVVDVDAHGRIPYLVMQLARGGSALDWMRRNGPMPPRMAVGLAIGCCHALEYTHARGVVHRDVKPHNILIHHEDGRAVLTDFGIARADDAVQLTANGAAMGTFAFMPPEQRADAHSVTERADVYALGATLYTMLTAKTSTELFLADSKDQMLSGLPESLRPILMTACKYEPELRYATMADLRAALEAALDALPPDPEGGRPLVQEVIPLPTTAPAEVGVENGLDDLLRVLTPDGSGGGEVPGTNRSQPGTGTTDPGKTNPGTGKSNPGAGKTNPGAGKTNPGTGKTNPGEVALLPYSMPSVKRAPRSNAPPSASDELPDYLRGTDSDAGPPPKAPEVVGEGAAPPEPTAPAAPPPKVEPPPVLAPTMPPADDASEAGSETAAVTILRNPLTLTAMAVLLLVFLLVAGVGWGAWQKSSARAERAAATGALVAQVAGMEGVVEQLGSAGADLGALRTAFFAFHDAPKGDQANEAAHALAVLLIAEADHLGPKERGAPEIGELRRKLRAADEAEARYDAARSSLLGRLSN